MRKFGLGVLAAALAMSAGAAFADPMAAYYGNTVNITQPNGAVVRLHITEGGAYKLYMPDGTEAGGVWAIEGDQFCTTRMTPAPAPKQCRPAIDRKLGDTWEEDSPNGKVKYQLIAGQ